MQLLCIATAAAVIAGQASAAANARAPHGLRVDHTELDSPDSKLALAVSLAPILSWRLQDDAGNRAQTQTAFEVGVGVAGSAGEFLWSSGKVPSANPEVQVPPQLLQHATEYEWRVRVWLHQSLKHNTPPTKKARTHSNSIYALANAGAAADSPSDPPSEWSDRHRFETAVAVSSWDQGSWIGGGNMFRTDVVVPAGKKVKSARAYVTALGAFDFYVNGKKVGDHVMDPGQTVVTERVLYVPFDVTDLLVSGSNAIGATVGTSKYGYLDVWCNSTAHGEQFGNPGGACMTLRAQLNVTMTDGSSVTVSTDTDNWMVTTGPIVYNHLWHGEIYDARREVPGWASEPLDALVSLPTLGGEAAGWTKATAMSPNVGVLSPMKMQPIRIDRSVKPVNISKMTQTSYAQGCANGFADGNRFIRCGKCSRSSVPIVGDLFSAVFYQDCSNHLYHWVSPSGSGGGPSCGLPNPQEHEVLVEPAKMVGWQARYKGVFACSDLPVDQNRTHDLYVVDFGQNMAGFSTLKVTGKAGTTVTMQHTEMLDADGIPDNVYYPGDGAHMTPSDGAGGHGVDPGGKHVPTTCGMLDSNSGGAIRSGWYNRGWFECANQTDSYTLKGGGAEESYTPSFTYHGFRYVAIRGLPADYDFTEDTLTAHFVHSDVPTTGTLELPQMDATPVNGTQSHNGMDGGGHNTSDILNKVWSATQWSQKSQLWSIPTDCPQREKRGWMGDAHMSSSGLMFSSDAQTFHTNFLQNINDDQVKGCQNNPSDPFIQPCTGANVALNSGAVPDVSPFQTSPYGSNPGSVVWQSAYPVIAQRMWRHYADKAAIQAHWPSLNAFMAYLDRKADPKTHLVLTGGLSDWNPVGGNGKGPDTPADECSAFYGLLDTIYMGQMAEGIGEAADAAKYKAQAADARVAYHKHFWNPLLKVYSKGSQCSTMMALWLGVVPAELEATAVATMVRNIQSNKYGENHLDGGIILTTFMYDTLVKFGYAGLAIDTLLTDQYPSFGYMISQGGTTLWEAFEGTPHQMFGSWNHIMYVFRTRITACYT